MSRTLRLITAVGDLTRTLDRLIDVRITLAAALSDVARESRATNLIVRSQIEADPAARERLLAEAERQMDAPRRRPPHDPL